MKRDKVLHFICSMVPTVMLGVINPWCGLCLGAGLGIGKEVGDLLHGQKWKESWPDLIADLIGIAAGLVLAIAARRWINGW